MADLILPLFLFVRHPVYHKLYQYFLSNDFILL